MRVYEYEREEWAYGHGARAEVHAHPLLVDHLEPLHGARRQVLAHELLPRDLAHRGRLLRHHVYREPDRRAEQQERQVQRARPAAARACWPLIGRAAQESDACL